MALSADPGALPPAVCPSGAVSQPSPVWAVPQHSPILTKHLHSCSQLQVRQGPHPPHGQSSWGAAGPLWGTQKRLDETGDTGWEGHSQRFLGVLLHGQDSQAGRSQLSSRGRWGPPNAPHSLRGFHLTGLGIRYSNCEKTLLSHHQCSYSMGATMECFAFMMEFSDRTANWDLSPACAMSQ